MSTQVQSYDPSYRHLCIKLDKLAPRFMLPTGAIRVLYEPAEFYETLKSKISAAKHSVFLSTLYIGTAEHELVRTTPFYFTADDRLMCYIRLSNKTVLYKYLF
jgi:CDP-diacylglycerol--glycerol-3-phosphate 3-phosphatidyltransferase